MEFFILATGAWMIGYAMMIHTTNWQSSMLFRVIPTMFGIGLIFSGLKMAGFIFQLPA